MSRMCANCHEKPFEVAANGLVSYQLFKLSEVGHEPAGRRELRPGRPRGREGASLRRRGVQHPREPEEAGPRCQQRLGADAGRMGKSRAPAGAAHAQHACRRREVSGFEGRARLSSQAAGGDLGDGSVSEQRIGGQHVGSAHGGRGEAREVSARLARYHTEKLGYSDDGEPCVAGARVGIRYNAALELESRPRGTAPGCRTTTSGR